MLNILIRQILNFRCDLQYVFPVVHFVAHYLLVKESCERINSLNYLRSVLSNRQIHFFRVAFYILFEVIWRTFGYDLSRLYLVSIRRLRRAELRDGRKL